MTDEPMTDEETIWKRDTRTLEIMEEQEEDYDKLAKLTQEIDEEITCTIYELHKNNPANGIMQGGWLESSTWYISFGEAGMFEVTSEKLLKLLQDDLDKHIDASVYEALVEIGETAIFSPITPRKPANIPSLEEEQT